MKSLLHKFTLKQIISIVLVALLGIAAGCGVGFNISAGFTGQSITISAGFSMELADEQVPALVENEAGEEVYEDNIVTVEEVAGDQVAHECPEGEECGQGRYIYAPTDLPASFKNYVYGGCWNTDGYYGAQCWDLADLFWENYAGRNFSTCGTGAAKGSWNCKEKNAGDEFELIYNPADLQAGDWVIFSSGQYGHVGMAMGNYNNGYVTLLGQNQGGAACEGGGSAANIINISLKSFVGAFRPKTYIKPEPTPAPTPAPTPLPISNCVKWHVERGDTMSKIMLECEGTVVYGDPMDAYAKTWYSLIYKPNQSVYDGWHSETGVGLYAGDDIEHRIGN